MATTIADVVTGRVGERADRLVGGRVATEQPDVARLGVVDRLVVGDRGLLRHGRTVGRCRSGRSWAWPRWPASSPPVSPSSASAGTYQSYDTEDLRDKLHARLAAAGPRRSRLTRWQRAPSSSATRSPTRWRRSRSTDPRCSTPSTTRCSPRSAPPSRPRPADPAVVATVVTGEGRGFCAGLDASVLAATAEGRWRVARRSPRTSCPACSATSRSPKPSSPPSTASTAGGGFVLAAMSDLRFASTTRPSPSSSPSAAWSPTRLDVAAAAPSASARPSTCCGRRARSTPPSVPMGSSSGSSSPTSCSRRRAPTRGPRRQRLAGVDRRHQADRVRPRRRRPASVVARRRRGRVGGGRPRRRARRGAIVLERRPPKFDRLGG